MSRGGVRARMVEGAVRLLATRGLEGTSLNDVLAAAGAPRGSLYHHFPKGKAELVHAALDVANEHAMAALEASRGQPAPIVVQRFLDLWRALLDRSQLSAGCAVLAVTVAADDAGLLDHAGEIFSSWTARLSDLLMESGMPRDAAEQLAVTLVAATEGAVAMSRAQRSRESFDRVAVTLLSLVAG